MIKVPTSPGKTRDGCLLYNKNASSAPNIAIVIMETSYFPIIMQEAVREVMAMTPNPDSTPFNPANILVKLDAMETDMGIIIRYRIPTSGGATQIKGNPAKKSKRSFSREDNITKSSTIPTIPTRRITSRVMINS